MVVQNVWNCTFSEKKISVYFIQKAFWYSSFWHKEIPCFVKVHLQEINYSTQQNLISQVTQTYDRKEQVTTQTNKPTKLLATCLSSDQKPLLLFTLLWPNILHN